MYLDKMISCKIDTSERTMKSCVAPAWHKKYEYNTVSQREVVLYSIWVVVMKQESHGTWSIPVR